MSITLYNEVLLATWVLTLCLGLMLEVGSQGRIAGRNGFDRYNTSRRLMGLSFILLGLQVMIHWLFNPRLSHPAIANAINLTCYYYMAVVMAMSVISLIEHNYITRRQMTRDLGAATVVSIILWIAALFIEPPLQRMVIVACAIFFAYDVGRMALHFFRAYRNAVNALDNYYADNVALFTHWLFKSVLLLIFTGFIGSFITFLPPSGAVVHLLIADVMCLYVFISMVNYAVNFEEIDVIVDPTKEEETLPAETEQQPTPIEADEALGEKVNAWLEGKSFLDPMLNIDLAARQMGTNRTYLSNYINQVEGSTFREWINTRRIHYACRVLTEQPELSVAEVATLTGFNSSTYFIRLFSKVTGTTPLKWRKTHGE